MKVQDVMMRTPAYCAPHTNLAAAVEILWNRNCGILPVVDGQEKVVGVVTDRDICIALGTRNRPATEVQVSEVTSGRAVTCRSDDNVRTALERMAQEKVRRLPVLDGQGRLEGILSMDDLVLRAGTGELTVDLVIHAMQRLYGPNLPEPVHQRAARA